MDKLIKYLESELERAKGIYEPIEKRFDDEEELGVDEEVDMNYYQGYADGIASALNKARIV